MVALFWRYLTVFTSFCSAGALAQEPLIIGEVTAVVAEASTADEPSELLDGASGDMNFPFIGKLKALATVGEIDAVTGKALTGYPDGHGAWLLDEGTVRVAYQSESYGTMSSQTYGWEMSSGAIFTGSHVHTIDYDRAGLAEFLKSDGKAADIVRGSGHLFNRVFNVFGDEVVPRAEGGVWGNQAKPDGSLVDFAPNMRLSNGDFFFHSFCGAWYEPAERFGKDFGFADDIWLMAEEWNLQRMFGAKSADVPVWNANDGMGLASMAVDIENEVAYTAPALGQSGYEKIMPINPQHTDYVVLVMAGYNHGLEPAPLRIYVGRKGLDASGKAVEMDGSGSDAFLARNGLLFGKIYGLAVKNEDFAALGIEAIDLNSQMLDAYMTNPNAADAFDGAFVASSYQWGGWDHSVAVKDTDMARWIEASKQLEGLTFLVGDSKTEHPAGDPDITRTRYVQNMTHKGGMLAIELPNIAEELAAAGGGLPEMLTASVVRTLAAVDGALTLEVGGKGVKHGGQGTHATAKNGRSQTVAPDGLYWVKAADADVLIVDEDSGNDYGERKFALVIDPATMMPNEAGRGYFLAAAGGKKNPRSKAGVGAYPGAFTKANSAEFSGTWNLTALLARKADGAFYTRDEIAGTGAQAIAGALPLDAQVLMGVVQNRAESGGPVAKVQADRGGQLFLFNLALPDKALRADGP